MKNPMLEMMAQFSERLAEDPRALMNPLGLDPFGDHAQRPGALREALNPGLFAPADHQATAEAGQKLREQASLADPFAAFRLWQDMWAAWFQLFAPATGLGDRYDIFISHAKADEAKVAELRARIDALGSVRSFVDWIDAPERDRAWATTETAAWLRRTMRRCSCLLLLLSEESAQSFWVQWELGFFDALRGRVFIVLLDEGARAAAANQEYIDLYPVFESEDALIRAIADVTGKPMREK